MTAELRAVAAVLVALVLLSLGCAGEGAPCDAARSEPDAPPPGFDPECSPRAWDEPALPDDVPVPAAFVPVSLEIAEGGGSARLRVLMPLGQEPVIVDTEVRCDQVHDLRVDLETGAVAALGHYCVSRARAEELLARLEVPPVEALLCRYVPELDAELRAIPANRSWFLPRDSDVTAPSWSPDQPLVRLRRHGSLATLWETWTGQLPMADQAYCDLVAVPSHLRTDLRDPSCHPSADPRIIQPAPGCILGCERPHRDRCDGLSGDEHLVSHVNEADGYCYVIADGRL